MARHEAIRTVHHGVQQLGLVLSIVVFITALYLMTAPSLVQGDHVVHLVLASVL